MTYTLDFALALGSSQTGLTLSAQLVDTAGSNVGGAVLTGFTEIGVGNYLWHYAAIPDGHRGGVKFSISGGALMAFAAINPEEAENVDAKTSTRSTYAGGDTAGVTELLTRIPDASPGANGGLATVDANNYVAGIQGALNQLDDLNNAAAAPAMITAQEVRDALKLAPSAGDPAAGSIDKHLDDIPTTTPLAKQDVADAMALAISPETHPAMLSMYNFALGAGTLMDEMSPLVGDLHDVAFDPVTGLAAIQAGVAAIPTNPYTGTPPDVTAIQGAAAAALIAYDPPTKAEMDSAIASVVSGGLDAQDIRDALKLAPTAGAPAAGSIDKHLDDLPSAAAIATAVQDAPTTGHTTAGTVGGDIHAASGVTDPLLNTVPGAYVAGTAGYIIGTYLDARVSRAGQGNGLTKKTYTVSKGGVALPDVTVLAFSDAACTVLIASGLTDEHGQCDFWLNAGTYYLVRVKAGVRFDNPDLEEV